MTVSTDLNNARYEGNGVTDTFAFNGRIFSTADLAVDIITRATDALVETLTGSDYTVTIIGPESVSVQVVAGKIPTGSQDILIRRSLGYTQPLRLPTGTVFPAVDVENGLDRNVAQMQDIAADIGRAIKLPVTSSLTDIELPQPTPSEIIGWNAAGDNLTTYSFAELTGSVDTIFTTLSANDFLVYNGTKWTNIDNDSLPVDGVVATSSAGVSLKNNTGTPVVIIGAGSGTGASFAGGVNASGVLNVSGTSTAAAIITLAEDTDNGTNKVIITPPQSIASDYTVTLPSASGTFALLSNINVPFLHLQDQKTSGTAGGTFTSGAWQTRTLNTEITDTIGSTLSSNQFTLPAGTYYIEAVCQTLNTNSSQARLQNITDTTTTLLGANSVTGLTAGGFVFVNGQFTITATKTFELQHRCSTTKATDGFGYASGWGVEVYAEVRVWKMA